MSWEIWLTAMLTLAIYSFLVGDNPVYRLAEHLLVGLSLGYALVIVVRTTIVPEAVTPLADGDWLRLVPIALGATMFLRLAGGRVAGYSRLALALIVGAGAGVSIPAMLDARILRQVRATIGGVDTVNGIIILIGVVCTTVYFYFTRADRGVTTRIARAGTWFMMMFFGATFAYTVMSRVALLIGRMEFLLGDWLGIVSR